MRTVDLALYADALAAKASAVGARLDRARDALRQAAIEQDARRFLEEATVARLERAGILATTDVRERRAEMRELAATLAALEELQAWVEAQLHAAREEDLVLPD